MKKIIIFILLFSPIVFFSPNVSASNLKFVENDKTIRSVSNVTQIKSNGLVTNDNNITTNQNINVFKMGDGVEVVTWSVLSNGKYNRQSTLNIAKDFEQKNPDFEVIAGVNGDYFSTETINANVIYGNRVLNPNNHQKYQAMEFDINGKKIKSHKSISKSDKVSLSLYDEEKSLIFFDDINNLNIIPFSKNQTTIHLNPINYTPDSSNKYFRIKNFVVHNVGSHVYLDGIIDEEIFSFEENVPVVMTSNQDLIEKLRLKPFIKVQKHINDFNENHMLLGYDGTILENNNVKEFNQMTGQSVENNTYRHPRTGFGFDSNGQMILFTVDGRLENSVGVDNREFAKILNQYGFVEAYNLDGGGSTQVVLRVDDELIVVNTPSELPLRPVTNAILFIKKV